MRTVLFASATATTSGGRLRRSRITHGSALVAFDRMLILGSGQMGNVRLSPEAVQLRFARVPSAAVLRPAIARRATTAASSALKGLRR
jgi:hypothetical protein